MAEQEMQLAPSTAASIGRRSGRPCPGAAEDDEDGWAAAAFG
jgi:hypothetical protein